MLPVLSGVLGALLFGVTGWFGRRIADSWYAGVERADDGPAPFALPQWAFVAVPAAIGMALGVRGMQPLQGGVLLVAVLSLAVCAATDARTGLIPDLFTLGPLSAVLLASAVLRDWAPLAGAAFALVPFSAIAVLSRGRGMGWGDVKLAVLGGALVGLGGITLAVAVASLAAYLAALFSGRLRRPIAFGPYLAASIGAALGFGTAV
jgi:prepilin signal peptidase PulO-like enzyme (type II secretory pathway)